MYEHLLVRRQLQSYLPWNRIEEQHPWAQWERGSGCSICLWFPPAEQFRVWVNLTISHILDIWYRTRLVDQSRSTAAKGSLWDSSADTAEFGTVKFQKQFVAFWTVLRHFDAAGGCLICRAQSQETLNEENSLMSQGRFWVFFLSADFDQIGNLEIQSNWNCVCNSTPYSRCFSPQDWGEGTKLQSVHHGAILRGLSEWSRQKLSPWWRRWSPAPMCRRSRGTKVPLVGREWSVTAMEVHERREFAHHHDQLLVVLTTDLWVQSCLHESYFALEV